MSRLASWLRSNRRSRIFLMAGTLLLPLLNLLSGAVVAMSAATLGWWSTLTDCLVGIAILVVLLAISGGPWDSAVVGALTMWAGALLGGHLLGRTGSFDLAVQVLVAVAVVAVFVISLMLPDARSYWLPILEQLIRSAGLPQNEGLPEDWLGRVAALMYGVIGASVLMSVLIALLLGGSLAASAEGHTGWRQQVLQLRLGRALTVAVLPGLAALGMGLGDAGAGVLLVLATGFVAQGLAVVHWTADHRGWPRFWSVVLYGPLMLSPSLAGLLLVGLMAAGILDNVISLRRSRTNVV
ncbi:MAG: hypothetical protein R3F27_03020 [Gammaproteobacteria bacterium]